jgi:hypothetical protein
MGMKLLWETARPEEIPRIMGCPKEGKKPIYINALGMLRTVSWQSDDVIRKLYKRRQDLRQ